MNKHGAVYRDSLGGYFPMFDIPGTRYRTSVLVDITEAIEEVLTPHNSKPVAPNRIPAGMTYLGQFIDHDMTFMRRTLEPPTDGPVDVENLKQERSPTLDLDTLYGDGYAANLGRTIAKTGKFIGPRLDETDVCSLLYDLPRPIYQWDTDILDSFSDEWFTASIPDQRNDENFLVAQLHVLFMNIHNKLVDILYPFFNAYEGYRAQGKVGLYTFEHAQRELIYLYQLVIVNDFLATFMDPDIFRYYFTRPGQEKTAPRLLDFSPAEQANIPIEFSGAAFRFGHSLVRNSYSIRGNNFPMEFFFHLTGKGRIRHRDSDNILRSSKKFLRDHIIDWDSFFDLDGDLSTVVNRGNYISPFLASDLRRLVNEKAGNQNLLLRNLLRGKELNLPCAQDIISYLNGEHPDLLKDIGIKELKAIDFTQDLTGRRQPGDPAKTHPLLTVLQANRLDLKTPLWLYILMEPQFNGSTVKNKTHLGHLGSIILGETFRMVLEKSNVSIYKKDPKIKPAGLLVYDLTRDQWSEPDDFLQNFKMKDLINFLQTDYPTEK